MNRGFSLIESVLYLGLVALLIPLIAVIIFFSADVRVRGQDISTITSEGERIVSIISKTIREAQSVNQPSWGESGSVLSLEMADSNKNPTIFQVNNGTIKIKEGASDEVSITSNLVTATGLIFSNKSYFNTPGTVRAEFTLVTPYLTKKFYVSGGLR